MAVHTIPLKPFDVPLTVTMDMPPGLRQDGLRQASTLPLHSLSRQTIMDMCAEFTERVLTVYDQQLAHEDAVQVARQARIDRGG